MDNTEDKKAEAAGAAEVKPAEVKSSKEDKAKAEPAKLEKAANCPVCNKTMKKKWYYRNGKYFCCKGCFKQSIKKQEGAVEKKPA